MAGKDQGSRGDGTPLEREFFEDEKSLLGHSQHSAGHTSLCDYRFSELTDPGVAGCAPGSRKSLPPALWMVPIPTQMM